MTRSARIDAWLNFEATVPHPSALRSEIVRLDAEVARLRGTVEDAASFLEVRSDVAARREWARLIRQRLTLAGIPQPRHMPCDTGDFSKDGKP